MPARRFSGPLNLRTVGKAGSKDPRDIPQFRDLTQFPDIYQMAQERAKLKKGFVESYSNAQAAQPGPDSVVRTLPTRTEMITWSGAPGLNFVPVLVVPKNLGRISLILNNYFTVGSGAGFDLIYYCFGAPITQVGSAPFGAALAATQSLVFIGESVPVNDVYMWHNRAGLQSLLAFEGIESPGSN